MHRVFASIIVISISVTLAFSQDSPSGVPGNSLSAAQRDDHNYSGPVQSGYAVVTPVAAPTSGMTSALAVATGTATGLVVFETFGMRSGNSMLQAGILPPDLTTNAILFLDSSARLSKNLGVAIVNPNASIANVTVTLRKNDGTQLATNSFNVPSHQQVSRFFTELFSKRPSVPLDVTGTLTITSSGSSNLPVSVIGLRFRGSNFSTVPVTDLSGNAGDLPSIAPDVGGPGAVLLPQFAAGGGWATELVLVNTGTNSLTVRVDLFKPDGTPLTATLNGQSASSFTNLTIPAGGLLILAPRHPNGDDDF